MGIITHIHKIPLFTTMREALAWAEQNGMDGYHPHKWKGQIGFMGGFSHSQATAGRSIESATRPTPITPTPQPVLQPTPTPTPTPQPTTTRTTRIIDPIPSDGGTTGGGGGY